MEQSEFEKQQSADGVKQKIFNTYIKNQNNNKVSDSDLQESIHQHEASETEITIDDQIEERGNERVNEQSSPSHESELMRLQDQLLRTVAEFDNFRRRTVKEKQELIEFGNQGVILKLLPVIDDLQNAVEVGKKNADSSSILTGLEIIASKAIRLLGELNVNPIVVVPGEPFNVEYHEALAQIPSEHGEGCVAQEVQRGYMLGNRVVRHSKVVTSAGKP